LSAEDENEYRIKMFPWVKMISMREGYEETYGMMWVEEDAVWIRR